MHRLRPVVAMDGFFDTDLNADERVRVNLDAGQFSPDILDAVCRRSQPGDRLAYGSGFESDPDMLESLQTCVPVLGNSSDTVRLCADPVQWSARLGTLGVTVPETRAGRPEHPEAWLVKQKGQAGGGHVQPASRCPDSPGPFYWQRQCAGDSYSALFLAGGGRARVVGISRLLPSVRADAPYAWAGAVGPVRVLPEVFEQVQWTVQILASDLDLLGLCGIDFIVDPGNEVQLVDLNPRLVATTELYADRFASDYMSAHTETCLTGDPNGRLVPVDDRRAGVRGLRVVYAPQPVVISAGWEWPAAAADLPGAGTRIEAGQPLCTVRDRYRDADEAYACLKGLSDQVLAQLPPDPLPPFSPGSLTHELPH